MDLSNLPLLVPHYENVGRLRTDISALLSSMPTLVPGVQTFRVSANQTQVLFFLQGSLEVTEDGSPCKVPVSIFFDPPYPSVPPRAFVTPDKNSKIVPNHPHVDGTTGLIRVPGSWVSGVPASLVQRMYTIITLLSQQLPLSCQEGAEEQLRQTWQTLLADVSVQENLKNEIGRKTAVLTEYLATLKVDIAALESDIGAQSGETQTQDPLAVLKCRPSQIGEEVLQSMARINALEDWLAAVEEAFKHGNISLDDVIKETRNGKCAVYVERASLKRNTALIHSGTSS